MPGKPFTPSLRTYRSILTVYLLIILFTLPFTRSWMNQIDRLITESVFVEIALAVFFVCFLLTLSIAPSMKRRTFFFFVFLSLTTYFMMRGIKIPIERVHLAEYGVLFFLLLKALPPQSIQRTVLSAFVMACGVGFLEECLQGLFPDRFFSWRDVSLNVAGSAAGVIYFGLYRTLNIKR
ncbi:MAG: hypothetical protein COW12_04505 [Candidatus Omnitrophica bacterium CG12_big_fil_rev_8_21_14_0_65_45_16]|nr:MAG: hypothetical protein COW12_04505 [Candidatus Omnitrophica bacterium CG12_big_fil_rev_8_21_14_0_65_45_16]